MAAVLLTTARYRETSAQIPSIRVSRASGHPTSKFNFPVFRSAATQTPYPVPRAEVRHQDVVREAHKQYSESLNKTMLVLLGVALFCLLTTIGSPDKLLLGADSTIKVPFADAPLSFLGFIVVAPFLLIVLVIYLHVFYGYWLECERERQYINQRLIPPIESIPTLFSFPDTVPRMLAGFVFYWLVRLSSPVS
jgi:hypothetical protein